MIAYTSPVNIEFMSGPIAFDTEPVDRCPVFGRSRHRRRPDARRRQSHRPAEQGADQPRQPGAHAARRRICDVRPAGERPARKRTAQRADFGSDHRKHGDARPAEPHGSSDAGAAEDLMLQEQDRRRHRQCRRQRRATRTVEKFEMAVPAPSVPGRQARMGGVMFNRVEAIAAMQAEKPVVESLGLSSWKGSPSRARARR